MNRSLPKSTAKESPVRAVSLGPILPRAMRGPQPAVALQSIGAFQVRNEQAAKEFQEMYSGASDPVSSPMLWRSGMPSGRGPASMI